MQRFCLISGKFLAPFALQNSINIHKYFSPFLLHKTINFLGLRYGNQMNIGHSLLWRIKQTEILELDDKESMKFVGWELNKNQKPQPRLVSMKDSMDPEVLVLLPCFVLFLNLSLDYDLQLKRKLD